MASLKDELAAIRCGAEGECTKPGRIPAAFLPIMHKIMADQRASGFRARMPALGQPRQVSTCPRMV